MGSALEKAFIQSAFGHRGPSRTKRSPFYSSVIPVVMVPVSMMIIMMMPMVAIIMVVIVICLNNITAVSAYCLWKRCNRCSFRRVRNSNGNKSCDRDREYYSSHACPPLSGASNCPHKILSPAQTYRLDPNQCGIGRDAPVYFAKARRADCRISGHLFCCLSQDAPVG